MNQNQEDDKQFYSDEDVKAIKCRKMNNVKDVKKSVEGFLFSTNKIERFWFMGLSSSQMSQYKEENWWKVIRLYLLRYVCKHFYKNKVLKK